MQYSRKQPAVQYVPCTERASCVLCKQPVMKGVIAILKLRALSTVHSLCVACACRCTGPEAVFVDEGGD